MKKNQPFIKFRYESFGGIISSAKPSFLAYITKNFAKKLGFNPSPLWQKNTSYLSAPTEVHFSITNQCTMNCRHCYMDSNLPLPDELSTEALKQEIDALAEKKVFHMALGGGEAFEREDLFEIAAYARQKGIIPNLTTNGEHITPENAPLCKVFGQINVSVDALDTTGDRLRNTRSLQNAVHAITLLKKNKVKVGINCVIAKNNFDQLPDIFAFAKKYRLKEIEFLRFKPSGRGKDHYHAQKTTREQNEQVYPLLLKLSKKYRITTKIDCSFMPMVCFHKPDKKQLFRFAAYGCEAGNILLGIKANGQVAPCSFSEDIGYSIGDFDQFWDSSPILTRFRTWTDHAHEPCKSCEYLDLCKGGCHPIALLETGDFYNGDPGCPIVAHYNKELSHENRTQ